MRFILLVSNRKLVCCRKPYRKFVTFINYKLCILKDEKKVLNPSQCSLRMVGMNDAMSILSGKWKFHILSALIVFGKMRFSDLKREVTGIGAKMLSKELQDLEMNLLITRSVKQTKPITVEYEITDFGRTLEHIIVELAEWGIEYRNVLINKNASTEV